MIPYTTDPKYHVRIMEIATSMKKLGLSDQFISSAARMALEYEGTYDLMVLWSEANDETQRNEIIADIQEEIDILEDSNGKAIKKPYVSFDDLETIAKDVVKFKKALRNEVDKRGGITELARLSGIPQPSLSRFFSSASMPRRTTLYKIAEALKLPEKIVVADWVA